MAFRDDREAAHARAEALARELAEKDAKLADRDARLAAAAEELEATRARLAEAEREIAPRTDARAALEAAGRRAASRDVAKARDEAIVKARETDEADHARTRRVLHSVFGLGDWTWITFAITLGIPGFWVGLYFATRVWGPLFFVIIGGVLGVSLVLGALVRRIARSRLAAEHGWAASRPYRLTGYPELLAIKPRSQVDVLRFPGRDRAGADGDGVLSPSEGHKYILVKLRFAGAEPADLDRVMRGFHDNLECRPSGAFRGTSPVVRGFSRSGRSSSTVDTNAGVREWVRRLDVEILEPLHRAHALEAVHLELR